MENQEGYDQWAGNYDLVKNKTRDLEAICIRSILENSTFNSCLEIGCGTGKNTQWLSSKCEALTAMDLSEGMLAIAKAKDYSSPVKFVQADITETWNFASSKYDLISFSLVLEHIQNLEHIFEEASKVLLPGGLIYIGELHPYKQYKGSKARFETKEGELTLACFTHHISDYVLAAQKHGLRVEQIREFFVPGEEERLPQILSLLLRSE